MSSKNKDLLVEDAGVYIADPVLRAKIAAQSKPKEKRETVLERTLRKNKKYNTLMETLERR